MEGTIEQGDTCEVMGDVSLGGTTVFVRGELVRVEMVEPNQQRPEYRYVVYSTVTGKRLQLSDRELSLREKGMAPVYHSAAEPWAMRSGTTAGELSGGHQSSTHEMRDSARDFFSGRRFLYIVVAVLAVTVSIVLFSIFTGKSGPEATLDRFFKAAEANDLDGMLACWDETALVKDPANEEFVKANFMPRQNANVMAPGYWNIMLASSMRYTTKVSGDQAVVRIRNAESSGDAAARLTRNSDGEWYMTGMVFGQPPWTI